MRLSEYLSKNKIKLNRFAEDAGLKQPYASLIKNGHKRPSPDVALRIEQATNGEVTVLELLYPNKEEL
jgi:transcriptional regulator with XRE-family HTH domain